MIVEAEFYEMGVLNSLFTKPTPSQISFHLILIPLPELLRATGSTLGHRFCCCDEIPPDGIEPAEGDNCVPLLVSQFLSTRPRLLMSREHESTHPNCQISPVTHLATAQRTAAYKHPSMAGTRLLSPPA